MGKLSPLCPDHYSRPRLPLHLNLHSKNMNLGPITLDIASYIKGQVKGKWHVQKNSNLHMNYCPPVFVAVGAE